MFKVADNFTDKMRAEGAEMDVYELLKAAAHSGIPDYTQVWIRGTFPTTDVYGNTEDSVVVNVTFYRKTVERINWDEFTWDNTYEIADVKKLHPQMRP